MHRDRRRVRKIDLRRYELAPRHNDFAHAVRLSNGHKRAGHPRTGNASASDFVHFTELNLAAILPPLRPCHSPVCRDIGVRESKAGYSFSWLRLLTGPASCPSHISIACGRFIVRLHRTCRSKQTPSASCRTISMPFGHCLPAMPILRSFHSYVKDGLLPADWGGDMAEIQGRFGE
jgi:hypothetical protein